MGFPKSGRTNMMINKYSRIIIGVSQEPDFYISLDEIIFGVITMGGEG